MQAYFSMSTGREKMSELMSATKGVSMVGSPAYWVPKMVLLVVMWTAPALLVAGRLGMRSKPVSSLEVMAWAAPIFWASFNAFFAQVPVTA